MSRYRGVKVQSENMKMQRKDIAEQNTCTYGVLEGGAEGLLGCMCKLGPSFNPFVIYLACEPLVLCNHDFQL